jgi:hypothetical protein
MNSGSELPFPWIELAIAPTRDDAEIKRAYARRLKTIDPAADPRAFQMLRRAYEAALGLTSGGRDVPDSPVRRTTNDPPPDSTDAPGESAAQFEALIGEAERLGLADNVTEAMAAIERFLNASAWSPNYSAHLQARLLCLVMDDPKMPMAMLGALAERFRWGDVGNALEQFRPDLQQRFLYRLTAAHEWLQGLKATAQRPDREGAAARFVLLPYSGEDDHALLGDFNAAEVGGLLNGARRFGPLLGDVIDPRRVKFLHGIFEEATTRRRKKDQEKPPQSKLRRKLRTLQHAVGIVIFASLFVAGVSQAIQYGKSVGLMSGPVSPGEDSPFPITFAQKAGGANVVAHVTRLLGAVTEIRYGLDKIITDRQSDCASDTNAQIARPGSGGRAMIELPPSTHFITVQFCYRDDVASGVFRFDLSANSQQSK